jgi:hypothetical protein
MYIVRGMTGATPVLLVAHSARERKSWLQDLYSCIDDTVSKHYLRIGKPKKASQPGIHISIPIAAAAATAAASYPCIPARALSLGSGQRACGHGDWCLGSCAVEERKQVVHRELLGIMQLRKDEYFQYLRHSRSSAVPSHLTKSTCSCRSTQRSCST